MTKIINTLVDDIYGLLGKDNPFDIIHTDEFGRALAGIIAGRVRSDSAPSLRMSNLGSNCDRKLWYSINHPELGEVLSPNVRVKFLFGDILEALLIFLAKQSGHVVTHEQLEVEIDGVKGHIDCLIDGHLIDVKSASSISFTKFRDGTLAGNDSFGYLTQLGSYLYSCRDLLDVYNRKHASFLVIDKQLGHICLSRHRFDTSRIPELVKSKRSIVSQKQLVPERGFRPEPDGKSGNQKLPTACGYCAFRQTCWPTARTFLYSSGPRYLTTVARLPDVPEVR